MPSIPAQGWRLVRNPRRPRAKARPRRVRERWCAKLLGASEPDGRLTTILRHSRGSRRKARTLVDALNGPQELALSASRAFVRSSYSYYTGCRNRAPQRSGRDPALSGESPPTQLGATFARLVDERFADTPLAERSRRPEPVHTTSYRVGWKHAMDFRRCRKAHAQGEHARAKRALGESRKRISRTRR